MYDDFLNKKSEWLPRLPCPNHHPERKYLPETLVNLRENILKPNLIEQ
jgi:hypothetical protein